MKVLVVAPPFFVLDPSAIGYGGTERVVIQLVLGLLNRGHEVSIIAARGSRFPGATVFETFNPVDTVSGANEYYLKSAAQQGLFMNHITENADYDIIHNHVECWQAAKVPVPMVFTHHNGWSGIGEYYSPIFSDAITHVTISDSEKRLFQAGGVSTERVHNGVDIEPLIRRSMNFQTMDYIALLGRFSAEKGFHIGIQACIRAGIPVKIAAKLPGGGEDLQYYCDHILPLLDNHLVEYVGSVNEQEKSKFLGEAKLVLIPNPHYRTEPFGLVVIEALSCGCSVVGSSRGAVAELVGNCGSTFEPPEEEQLYIDILAERITHTLSQNISMEDCRQRARAFGINQMVEGYIKVYQKVIAKA